MSGTDDIKSVIRKHILNGVIITRYQIGNKTYIIRSITRYQIGNQKTYIKRDNYKILNRKTYIDNHKISNR